MYFEILNTFRTITFFLEDMYSTDVDRFTSIVTEDGRLNVVYTQLLNDVFTIPEERYQPFLTDPVMMAIVNEHFEFEIDNVLITQVNNEELLISDPNDSRTRNEIRNLPKGEELDFDSIPQGAYWGNDTDTQAFLTWCGCSITIERIGCDEIEVSGTCKDFAFGAGSGEVEIVITDQLISFPPAPPSIQTLYAQRHIVNNNFSFIVNTNNLPGINNLDEIFVFVSADPNCFVGSTQIERFNFDPHSSFCDLGEGDTGWLWAQDNGSQGMSYRVNYYKNWRSSYSRAELYSKRWNGNSWVTGGGDLEARIDETKRNFACLHTIRKMKQNHVLIVIM